MIQRKAARQEAEAERAGSEDEAAAVSMPEEPAEKEADQVADQVAASLHGGEGEKTDDGGAAAEKPAHAISAKLEGVGRKLYLAPDDDWQPERDPDRRETAETFQPAVGIRPDEEERSVPLGGTLKQGYVVSNAHHAPRGGLKFEWEQKVNGRKTETPELQSIDKHTGMEETAQFRARNVYKRTLETKLWQTNKSTSRTQSFGAPSVGIDVPLPRVEKVELESENEKGDRRPVSHELANGENLAVTVKYRDLAVKPGEAKHDLDGEGFKAAKPDTQVAPDTLRTVLRPTRRGPIDGRLGLEALEHVSPHWAPFSVTVGTPTAEATPQAHTLGPKLAGLWHADSLAGASWVEPLAGKHKLEPKAFVSEAQRWAFDPSWMLTSAALTHYEIRDAIAGLATAEAAGGAALDSAVHQLHEAVLRGFAQTLDRTDPAADKAPFAAFAHTGWSDAYKLWSDANRDAVVDETTARADFFRWGFDDAGQLTDDARKVPGLPSAFQRLPAPSPAVDPAAATSAVHALVSAFLSTRAGDHRAAGRDKDVRWSGGGDVQQFKPARRLHADEIADATAIFGNSVDFSVVGITMGGPLAEGATRTLGDLIAFQLDEFSDPITMKLSSSGRETLIHELTHVWQFQHGGIAYALNALRAQASAAIFEGDRNAAYEFKSLLASKKPWADWNPEQQGYLVQKYWRAQRAIDQANKAGREPAPRDVDFVKEAQPYIDEVRAGRGAPDGPDL